MTDSNRPKPVSDLQQAAQSTAQANTAPPPVRHRRTIIFQAALIASLGLFGALAVLASGAAYFPIDLTITQALQGLRSPVFHALMVAVSWLGYMPQAAFTLLLPAAVAWWLGYRWEAKMIVLSTAAVVLVNVIVKTLVNRPRPASTLVEVYTTLSTHSFPSGHVMFAVGLFGFLLFLAFTLMRPSWLRVTLIVLFAMLIALTGLSRIYLGEHWASDVLGAYLLGMPGLAAAVAVYQAGKRRGAA
ncbi:MAG TPA: phosphatase PAP2 family protein [Anaerolineaceae bacterium]